MVCLETTFMIDLINGRISIDYLEKNFSKKEIFIASPTILEIIRGLNLESNSKNIKPREEEETKRIISLFSVLDFGKEEAILAGEIEARLSNEGSIIDIEDIMTGAICIKNEEILVTKNKKHFEKIPDLKISDY
ncbi:hypothetical protein COU60_02130 [Candidatus Pacearchaeota archaeon CG10_big_fil_rev_8_21_14_0_10_34_76]|nr:MAG: hypothetical protein COU60_02130 [Candidatus Pacearchaeota archaeon CG10_big_fil_rev_8_21_14_0_10_34_76]